MIFPFRDGTILNIITPMRTLHAAFRILPICVVLAAALPSGALDGAGVHRAPMLVVDTDMGLDDVRALFAILPAAGTRIAGIVVTEGSASREKGVENLASLLAAMHEEDVAVFEGARPAAAPPEWRETANTLGGAPISRKPLGKSAAGDVAALRSRLAAEASGVNYLALGPLTSAADLLADPRARAAVDTLWIPARVNGASVSGWNLRHDAAAAAFVAEKGRCVVLIDVSSAAALDAPALLASIDRASPTGRWIARSQAAASDPRHVFLHDELAAAALARPAILEWTSGAFRLERAGEGFTLVPASAGNVRVAAPRDPAEAAGALAALWNAPAHHAHDKTPAVPVVDLLKTFHGHLGPYVVIGYRMGRLALEATGSEGHFGISVVVYSVLEPPRSCLIDGVQLGSGCTLGKRNIEVRATDGPARAVFETDDGSRVTIALRPEAAALVARLIEERGVEAAGMAVLDLPADELFEIDREPRKN